MCFRFADYGPSELARCGEALLRAVRGWPEARDFCVTRSLALAWLDGTAPDGVSSVAGPVLRELGAVPQALDLAHVDTSDGRLRLAVAYEPPDRHDRFAHVYVLARAAALAATESRAKLLISIWRGPAAHRMLVDCVLELREQLKDPAPWLWLEPSVSHDGPLFTLLEPG